MSLWICQQCHSLQGFSKSMRCFACEGPLAFATVTEKPAAALSQRTPDTPSEAPTDDEVLDFLVAYYGFPNRAMMESFKDWQMDIRDEVKLIQSWATLRPKDTK
jgi:hypothetical protein